MTTPKRRPQPPAPRRRGAAWLAAITLVLLGGLWAMGLAWFADDAQAPAPPPGRADGIVALTGGQDRIATALALLRQGCCAQMLISGVGPAFDLDALLRNTGGDQVGLAGRITLGHTATDTLGNAAETALWAKDHHITSLIVVTAGYHMRRALLDMGPALPGVRLIPAKVVPPVLRTGGLHRWRLLAAEYTKYLAASLGLNRPPREPQNATGASLGRHGARAAA